VVSYELIEQSALERRLDDPEIIKSDYALSDSEWDTLLGDVIEEESGYVAQLVSGQGVDLSTYQTRSDLVSDYPIIRTAMVRLCRQALHNIEEDGLESESAADRSESYRPPAAIREEVANLIGTIEPPDDGSDDDDDGQTRVAII
jgi:hypothetical protein